MWEIKHNGVVKGKFDTLNDAILRAQYFEEFVIITDGTTEIVGKFGVDAIEDKILPDGESYDWTMRRDENHRSSRKKLV